MKQITSLDLEGILSTLQSISDRQEKDSQEQAVVQFAAISVLYALHLGKLDDLYTYYQETLDPSFKLQLARTFTAQEEADAWLSSGQAHEGDRVLIEGKGQQVVRLKRGLRFIHAPLPEELEPSEEDT